MNEELKLCYISENWAYFTTQDIAEQWGDDWDDAPYEHNAGKPYESHKNPPKWNIVKVAFDGFFETPCSNVVNSPWSVQRINQGAIAWLNSSSWSGKPQVSISAGISILGFKTLIEKAGGQVYFTNQPPQR